jgi:hypothetical protein
VELDPDLSYYIPLEKRKFGCRWEPALDIFHESRTFCGANLSLNEFDHPEEHRTTRDEQLSKAKDRNKWRQCIKASCVTGVKRMRYDNNVARFDRCLFSHPHFTLKFLKFVWEDQDQMHAFKAVPFDISTTPRKFTRIV